MRSIEDSKLDSTLQSLLASNLYSNMGENMKLIIQIQTVISKMRKYLLQSSIRYNFQHKNISHGISHIRNYTSTITPSQHKISCKEKYTKIQFSPKLEHDHQLRQLQ